MGAAIKITRADSESATLRRHAVEAKDPDVVRRLLALALIAEGKSRAEAAAATGMDRQTLRDWVHRYNEHGIAGLANMKPPGRPPMLSREQLDQLADWVRQGPDIEKDGIIRWRLSDLAVRISEEFQVGYHRRGVGKILHRLGFRHISARPQHPRQDPQSLEEHKKTLPNGSLLPFPTTPETSRSNSGGRTRPGLDSKAP